MKALIIVDMQNDFIDGSLPVPGAVSIVAPIQNYIRDLLASPDSAYICFTGCAHPKNHASFEEFGGLWPPHCIRGTLGADLQFGLQSIQRAYALPLFQKGREAEVEEYSGFANVLLREGLELARVKQVEVCGLARNYCVEQTADAARRYGYEVTVLEHLCRSV